MEIWTARLERCLTEQERLRLLDCLPPARRQRLERLQIREKWDEALCAYALLALALRESRGLESLPAIALTEKGKPYFPELPQLHFSLSHTEGAVLLGLADTPVGVDIEKVRPVSRRLLQQTGAETAEDFFPLWVRREARGKCSGVGIGPLFRREPPEAGETCFALETFPGYAAAAAVMGQAQPPQMREAAQEQLLQL